MSNLLILAFIFGLLATICHFSYDFFKRRRRVETLKRFIKQGQQLRNTPFSQEDYDLWINIVNTYLAQQLTPDFQVRFNKVRKTRNQELQDHQEKLMYALDGHLFRLAEFTVELKGYLFKSKQYAEVATLYMGIQDMRIQTE